MVLRMGVWQKLVPRPAGFSLGFMIGILAVSTTLGLASFALLRTQAQVLTVVQDQSTAKNAAEGLARAQGALARVVWPADIEKQAALLCSSSDPSASDLRCPPVATASKLTSIPGLNQPLLWKSILRDNPTSERMPVGGTFSAAVRAAGLERRWPRQITIEQASDLPRYDKNADGLMWSVAQAKVDDPARNNVSYTDSRLVDRQNTAPDWPAGTTLAGRIQLVGADASGGLLINARDKSSGRIGTLACSMGANACLPSAGLRIVPVGAPRATVSSGGVTPALSGDELQVLENWARSTGGFTAGSCPATLKGPVVYVKNASCIVRNAGSVGTKEEPKLIVFDGGLARLEGQTQVNGILYADKGASPRNADAAVQIANGASVEGMARTPGTLAIEQSSTLTYDSSSYASLSPSTLVSSAASALPSSGEIVPYEGCSVSGTCGSDPVPPVNGTPPSITGNPIGGATVNGDRGTWTGQEPISYAYQWSVSAVNGEAPFSTIAGATGETFVIPARSMAGQRLRLTVTATNEFGSTQAVSDPSARISVPPIPGSGCTALISGTAKVLLELSATACSYDGYPAPVIQYQWQFSDTSAPPTGWSDYPAADGQAFAIPLSQVARYARVRITATNGAGSDVMFSAASDKILGRPFNINLPTISSTYNGARLSSTTGAWNAHPAAGFRYRWQSSDAQGSSGTWTDIADATNADYIVACSLAGKFVRANVTAFNSEGDTAASSSGQAGIPVGGLPSLNVNRPTLTGGTKVGTSTGSTPGDWTGCPAPTYTYQWQTADDASGTNQLNISGATLENFTPLSSQAGKFLRVTVTASNGVAPAPAAESSNWSQIQLIPEITSPPTISGTVQTGFELTATKGSWQGVPTPSLLLKWQIADGSGADSAAEPSPSASWEDAPGSTSNSLTYEPPVSAACRFLRVNVTATNAAGALTESSAVTVSVKQLPANSVPPSLTVQNGDPLLPGATLVADPGIWGSCPTPPTFTYEWQQADGDSVDFQPIPGAANTGTFRVGSEQYDMKIRVKVTAVNGITPDPSALSTSTANVPSPPKNTVEPSVTGSWLAGEQLTGVQGTWRGTVPITYSYNWQRSASVGSGFSSFDPAETSLTLSPSNADRGKFVRLTVKAENTLGLVEASSTPAQMVGSKPVNSSAPAITGSLDVGQTLTASAGVWDAVPTADVIRRWERCNPSSASCAVEGNWLTIISASASTYTTVRADAGNRIRVVERAQNPVGGQTYNAEASGSTATAIVGSAPAANPKPVIAITGGVAQITATVNANDGTWTGVPTPTVSARVWLRCDAAGAACVNIAGATTGSYALVAADVGSTIRFRVTATNLMVENPGPAVSSDSNQTAVVQWIAPVNTVAPAFTSGNSNVSVIGTTYTADNGTWTGNATPTLERRWQRCNPEDETGDCVDITPLASGASYTSVAADLRSRLRLRVLATNAHPNSPVSAYSNQTVTITPSPCTETTAAVVAATNSAWMKAGLIVAGGTLTETSAPINVGIPVCAVTQEWQRVRDSDGLVTPTGNTSKTYTAATTDAGYSMRIKYISTNAAGSVTSYSNAIGVSFTQMGTPGAPSFSSDNIHWTDSLTITTNPPAGGEAGTPAGVTTTSWRACSNVVASCIVVAGVGGVTSTSSAGWSGPAYNTNVAAPFVAETHVGKNVQAFSVGTQTDQAGAALTTTPTTYSAASAIKNWAPINHGGGTVTYWSNFGSGGWGSLGQMWYQSVGNINWRVGNYHGRSDSYIQTFEDAGAACATRGWGFFADHPDKSGSGGLQFGGGGGHGNTVYGCAHTWVIPYMEVRGNYTEVQPGQPGTKRDMSPWAYIAYLGYCWHDGMVDDTATSYNEGHAQGWSMYGDRYADGVSHGASFCN